MNDPKTPHTPLSDAMAFLRSAVERLAVGDGTPRERARRALEMVGYAERTRAALPAALVARLEHVAEWARIDPTLEELPDRDVAYLAIGIVAALHEAVRLQAIKTAGVN